MTLRAYYASIKGEDWVFIVHGESRGKAKYRFVRRNPEGSDRDTFILARLTRIPAWDDRPFDDSQECRELFSPIDYDKEGYSVYGHVFNDCDCPLCVVEK